MSARLVVTAAVLAEAVTVIGYAGYLGVVAVTAPAPSRLPDALLSLTTLLLGLGLLLVTRAVWHGRRGARAPVLVWQMLQGVVAVPAVLRSPEALVPGYVGVPLAVLCLVAGFGVMRPDVTDDA